MMIIYYWKTKVCNTTGKEFYVCGSKMKLKDMKNVREKWKNVREKHEKSWNICVRDTAGKEFCRMIMRKLFGDFAVIRQKIARSVGWACGSDWGGEHTGIRTSMYQWIVCLCVCLFLCHLHIETWIFTRM